MPDMAIVINGRSTHIHADLTGINRLERFFVAGQCVVELDAHRGNECGAAMHAASA